MLCIESQSFIYVRAGLILGEPPEEAADMTTFDTILGAVREIWLSCTGSPLSRSRQLAALRKLDTHLLADIGLTPDEARRGVPFGTTCAKDTPRTSGGVEIRNAYR
jgi:uncharacterized protein YjiS (DUF1127 family)